MRQDVARHRLKSTQTATLRVPRHLKTNPVDIYEPQIELELAPAELIAKCERHEEAMEYYISGDFAQSLAIFTELGQQYPKDKIYLLFLERITVLMESDLPDDWHGVYIHTSK